MNMFLWRCLSRNQPVQMSMLGRICNVSECNVGDIIDYIKDGGEDK